MCMLKNETLTLLKTLLLGWTAEGKTFDVMMMRDNLRKLNPSDFNITYNEVFPQVWHLFRKGVFAQPYIIRTKTVQTSSSVIPGTKSEVTIEYVPENGVVLKKVQEKWRRQ